MRGCTTLLRLWEIDLHSVSWCNGSRRWDHLSALDVYWSEVCVLLTARVLCYPRVLVYRTADVLLIYLHVYCVSMYVQIYILATAPGQIVCMYIYKGICIHNCKTQDTIHLNHTTQRPHPPLGPSVFPNDRPTYTHSPPPI